MYDLFRKCRPFASIGLCHGLVSASLSCCIATFACRIVRGRVQPCMRVANDCRPKGLLISRPFYSSFVLLTNALPATSAGASPV